MKSVLRFLVLPKELTDFERKYLERLNRIALVFFAMHIPVFGLIAWLNDTRPLLAVVLTSITLAGPVLAHVGLRSPRAVSVVHGVTAMFMGGLLVHFGQGPVQIEMHFYFFSLLAMCAVFGNPMVVVAATVTVALHHLIIWTVLPRSVFNYDAAWWVVAVHAAFVVVESVATCFIARSFFDNVIGLEKIVQARTAALDAKNRDMRLLLDNVQQGFLTIDREGVLASERSAVVDGWFGAPGEGGSWFDYLNAVSPDFANRTRPAWTEVVDGIMPVELTLDQMPHRVAHGTSQYHVDYRPIGDAEPYERFLVVITDITLEVQREQAEQERREAMAVFERVLVDRSGLETFFEEATNIVEALAAGKSNDMAVVKRLLHTLKGNASLYGIGSVAKQCHDLEDFVVEESRLPEPARYAVLLDRWARLSSDIEKLLGKRGSMIEIDEKQYQHLLESVRSGLSKAGLVRVVESLQLEPTARRLRHFAEQARRIAERLDKGDVEVRVDDHGVRLDAKRWAPFWSSFIHAVRNAVDHGLEAPDARIAAGKPTGGRVTLRTMQESDRLVIEVIDDGRGIDWRSVAQRASKSGLPSTTPEDLQHALFVDGVSTATNVTDVSGRGVGMGALLFGTRALGGTVVVESEPGKGTLLRMTFPFQRTPQSIPCAPAA